MSTRSQLDPAALDFDKGGGLIVVIAQDVATGSVLMTGFANRAAVEATLATGELHFWSRSRDTLWRKGESSGNTLSVVSLAPDCDGDALLASVRPAGPTCHTGRTSCFGVTRPAGLAELDATIASRADEPVDGSYTTRLLSDRNLRLKKLGEETAELVTALASGEGAQAVEEAADLVYHVLVALRAEGRSLGDVEEVLESRRR